MAKVQPRATSLVQDILDLAEANRGLRTIARARPQEEVLPAAVIGPGERVGHRLDPVAGGIEDAGTVGKIVADDQVDVPIAVEVGLGRRTGVPALECLDQLAGDEPRPRQ